MLTGKYFFKKNFFGGFNVYVEEKYTNVKGLYDFISLYQFRKAKLEELSILGIKLQCFDRNKKTHYEYFNVCNQCGNKISIEASAQINYIKSKCCKCKNIVKLFKVKKNFKNIKNEEINNLINNLTKHNSDLNINNFKLVDENNKLKLENEILTNELKKIKKEGKHEHKKE